MEVNYFNDIRQVLLDPTPQGQTKREEISRSAAHAKTAAGIVMGVSGVLTVVSVVIAVSFPVIGVLAVLTCGTATLVSREWYVICGNVNDMMSNNGWFGNLWNRGRSALSPQLFADSLFKDTWVVGPLLSGSIVKELEQRTT